MRLSGILRGIWTLWDLGECSPTAGLSEDIAREMFRVVNDWQP